MFKILTNRYSEIFHVPYKIVVLGYLPATLLLVAATSVITLYFRNVILLFNIIFFIFRWNVPLIERIYALEKVNIFKTNKKIARRFLFYLFLSKNPVLLSGFCYIFILSISSLCLKDLNFFFLTINFFLINLISIISEIFVSTKNRLLYGGTILFLFLNFVTKSTTLLITIFMLELFTLYFTDKQDHKNTKYLHCFSFLYRFEDWLRSTNLFRIFLNKILFTNLNSKFFIFVLPTLIFLFIFGKFTKTFILSESFLFLTLFQFEFMIDKHIENFENITERIILFKSAKLPFHKRLMFSTYWDISRFIFLTIIIINYLHLGTTWKMLIFSIIECLFVSIITYYYFWLEEKELYEHIKVKSYVRVLIPAMIMSTVIALLVGVKRL
ncbi:MAG: hypothetical protein LBF82_02870 [Lactobacillales bacterium]|jgi:hypothetical protein|nr:hypothetical protein [Lactobacillales bacterium]